MKKLFGFIGMMALFFIVATLFLGGLSLLVYWLGIDWVIENGFVDSDKEYWQAVLLIGGILSVPPFFTFGFQAMPDEDQESVKVFGLAMLDILSIIGAGVLFAAGMTFYLSL